VSLSKLVQKTVITEYGICEDDTPVILNGMPVENVIKKSSYSIGETLKIAHVGRFSKPKNHIGLINAFEKVHEIYPQSILNLYGSGELEEEIKRYVCEKNMQDCVIFNGVVDNVPLELVKNDIFCLTSIYEGIPLSIIEAMACAMPIVATNVGGIPDMLDNSNACIVENDTETIATSIINLINSEEMRKTKGINAYMCAKRFSSDYMALNYLELYNKGKKI
jgi:glycosyltransferase involved in cell wall biosynthesis